MFLTSISFVWGLCTQEAAQYAEENGCVFFETSAKSGENVKEIILAMGVLLLLFFSIALLVVDCVLCF